MGCGSSKAIDVVSATSRPVSAVSGKSLPIAGGLASALAAADGTIGLVGPKGIPFDDPTMTTRIDGGNDENGDGTVNAVAFEVAAEPVDETDESLIRRHPPRRLRRLEEQQVAPSLTHDSIDEKQADAEKRRIEIINQRVQSARQRGPKSAGPGKLRTRPEPEGRSGGEDFEMEVPREDAADEEETVTAA